jgi:flagellar hook-basal body complex protein FliE
MSQALRSVSQTQFESQALQRELQLDNPTVSLEQTMIAMQKSHIGFQSVLQVRNRLVQAYSDIMNMQV